MAFFAEGGQPFYYGSRTITGTTIIGSTYNAMSIGPITISSGSTVTVSSDGRWVIV
jgi:hypothetical protein